MPIWDFEKEWQKKCGNINFYEENGDAIKTELKQWVKKGKQDLVREVIDLMPNVVGNMNDDNTEKYFKQCLNALINKPALHSTNIIRLFGIQWQRSWIQNLRSQHFQHVDLGLSLLELRSSEFIELASSSKQSAIIDLINHIPNVTEKDNEDDLTKKQYINKCAYVVQFFKCTGKKWVEHWAKYSDFVTVWKYCDRAIFDTIKAQLEQCCETGENLYLVIDLTNTMPNFSEKDLQKAIKSASQGIIEAEPSEIAKKAEPSEIAKTLMQQWRNALLLKPELCTDSIKQAFDRYKLKL